MVSDKRTYLSVGQYSYEAYVLMSDSLFYFGCWLIAFLSLVYCALLPVPFLVSADLPILPIEGEIKRGSLTTPKRYSFILK